MMRVGKIEDEDVTKLWTPFSSFFTYHFGFIREGMGVETQDYGYKLFSKNLVD